MKRLILCAAALCLVMAGCNKMEKDAELVVKKTCECYSLIDENDPSNSNEEAFQKCLSELEELEGKMNEKYSSPEENEIFIDMKYKAIMESDMPESVKEIFDEIYNIHQEGPDYGRIPDLEENDVAGD